MNTFCQDILSKLKSLRLLFIEAMHLMARIQSRKRNFAGGATYEL